MRTTVNLPDDLLATLKKRAAEQGTTVTALIEDSLRASLGGRRNRAKKERTSLATFGRKGLQPGVDLDDSAALLELMDSPHGAAGR
jgi:plasmid stability protein